MLYLTRKRCAGLRLVMLLVPVVFPGARMEATYARAQERENARAPAPWITFHPKEAPFYVRLPRRPKEGIINLQPGVRALSCGLETEGCGLGIEWARNLPDEMSSADAVERLIESVVKLIEANTGSGDFTHVSDRAVTIDGNSGREVVLEAPAGRIQIWGFVLTTKDFERPAVSHDLVAFMTMEDGRDSASQDLQAFFGSVRLSSCGASSDLALPDDPDELLDVLKQMARASTPPVPLNRPRPVYTAEARKANVQGIVRARARVGSDGKAKEVELIDHLPCGLDDEAMRAIRRMRFRPAKAGSALRLGLRSELNSDCQARRSNEQLV